MDTSDFDKYKIAPAWETKQRATCNLREQHEKARDEIMSAVSRAITDAVDDGRTSCDVVYDGAQETVITSVVHFLRFLGYDIKLPPSVMTLPATTHHYASTNRMSICWANAWETKITKDAGKPT